jgi:hypothetical protein
MNYYTLKGGEKMNVYKCIIYVDDVRNVRYVEALTPQAAIYKLYNEFNKDIISYYDIKQIA